MTAVLRPPALALHLADTSDAHDASAISFDPSGPIVATTVQAAILEAAAEGGSGGGRNIDGGTPSSDYDNVIDGGTP